MLYQAMKEKKDFVKTCQSLGFKEAPFSQIISSPQGKTPEDRWPHSGWKLHVASNVTHMSPIAHVVVPILLEGNTPFKAVIHSNILDSYLKNTQTGKFITIYCKNYDQALYLAKKLDKTLIPLKEQGISLKQNEIPWGDAQLGQSGLLFIRYGGFEDHHVTMVWPKGTPIHNEKWGYKISIGDMREVPIPEMIVRYDLPITNAGDRSIADTTLFPGLDLRWPIPGTTHTVRWPKGPSDYGSFPHKTWKDVSSMLAKIKSASPDRDKEFIQRIQNIIECNVKEYEDNMRHAKN